MPFQIPKCGVTWQSPRTLTASQKILPPTCYFEFLRGQSGLCISFIHQYIGRDLSRRDLQVSIEFAVIHERFNTKTWRQIVLWSCIGKCYLATSLVYDMSSPRHILHALVTQKISIFIFRAEPCLFGSTETWHEPDLGWAKPSQAEPSRARLSKVHLAEGEEKHLTWAEILLNQSARLFVAVWMKNGSGRHLLVLGYAGWEVPGFRAGPRARSQIQNLPTNPELTNCQNNLCTDYCKTLPSHGRNTDACVYSYPSSSCDIVISRKAELL